MHVRRSGSREHLTEQRRRNEEKEKISPAELISITHQDLQMNEL